MTAKISQKDYLKKYLSDEKVDTKKKRKKEKISRTTTKVKIIDDDDNDGTQVVIEEIEEEGEDAPQIVGEYVEKMQNRANKWRSFAVKEEKEYNDHDLQRFIKVERTTPDILLSKLKMEKESSPPRRRVENKSSPPQRRMEYDNSPPRQRVDNHSSPPRRRVDNDSSPPRRKMENDKSLPRWKIDNDSSPLRQKIDKVNIKIEKQSPLRKRRTSCSPNSDQSSLRKRCGDKISPKRSQHKTNHQSRIWTNSLQREHRTNSVRRRRNDQSPSRRRRHDSSSEDLSPIRKRESSEQSPRRWHDLKVERDNCRNRNISPPPTHKPKSTKTLDGKKAGLQDAISLRQEIEERRKKDARQGINTVGRDAEVQVRSTGRRGMRAREEQSANPEDQKRKELRKHQKEDTYSRWSKGLKQIEDHRAAIAEEAYEGSKPLARFVDDADLEEHLRQQERADDPMLNYMREKNRERHKKANIPTIPLYEGSFPVNRFGIRPGYRWDGVNRSNGYEEKWFKMQNEKQALREEAYKYSVEDM